jgi:putative Mg2+ transporter-C (MgtC) family protein
MAWHDQVWTTVSEDFSDVPSLAQVVRIILRLVIAALLGGALGLERKHAGKAAGVRTHMLVSLGSALFVLLPQQQGVSPADLTRVLQGVVTGIGFLGAGAILKSESEEQIYGLTTAAGIWLTAAIGIACGLGRQGTALLSTVLALAILTLLPRLESWLPGRK